MGKQEVGATAVGFVVSASMVIFALVVGDRGPGDEGAGSEQEAALPDWLTDYNLHVPIIGVFYSAPDRHPRRVGFSESDALMDSLSPGVRASYEGALLEREEAEHAGYAEWRMRRLREGRAARK